MQIGARTASWSVGELWKNPYITDGLVAMWDGEWNVGGGKHDDKAMAWKDIIRDIDCQYSKEDETPNWEKNCWRSILSSDGRYFIASYPDGVAYEHTVEIVAEKNFDSRGIIIGAYALYTAEPCNFEFYSSRNFRAYYNSNPDISTSAGTFPINAVKYFATRHKEAKYEILSPSKIVEYTSSWNRLKGSICHIGTDGRINQVCFHGRIYAIRIYNRALTDDEISENYSIDVKRFGVT